MNQTVTWFRAEVLIYEASGGTAALANIFGRLRPEWHSDTVIMVHE
jgi:hypothetical protein